jgi:hypothetical protein
MSSAFYNNQLNKRMGSKKPGVTECISNECNGSFGDLNGVQVHAHMQLAAMILFPSREILNPPFYAEKFKLPNVALILNSNCNTNTLFDLVQVCKLYNKVADVRKNLKDLQEYAVSWEISGEYKSLKICSAYSELSDQKSTTLLSDLYFSSKNLKVERPYMDAQDCLRFFDNEYRSAKPAVLQYKIFVDEVVVSSDHNESSNEKASYAEKPTKNKRFLTEARKQQMREYSKNSYYKNKALKQTQSTAQVNDIEILDPPPAYEASMDFKYSFPQKALVGADVHIHKCNAHDHFVNTCSTIMEDVVLALDDCDDETSKKRKRTQSIRNMATILFAANRFLFTESNDT